MGAAAAAYVFAAAALAGAGTTVYQTKEEQKEQRRIEGRQRKAEEQAEAQAELQRLATLEQEKEVKRIRAPQLGSGPSEEPTGVEALTKAETTGVQLGTTGTTGVQI